MGLIRVKNWISRKSDAKSKEDNEVVKVSKDQNKVDEVGTTPQ